MIQIKKLLAVVLCAVCLFTTVTNAQPLREADYAFKHTQYEKALEEYKKGIRKIKSNPIEVRRVTFQIAECYRIMGDLKRAEQQYTRLEKKNYQKDNPIILFHLGSIYNLRGEYDGALKYYNNYKKRVPEDTRVDTRIEGCQKAKLWTENPTRYEVENFKKINSKQDDWAPRWGNPTKFNQIIFTSNRDGSTGKGNDQWTGEAFSDLYRTDKPKSKNTEWPGEWSPVQPLDEEENVNSPFNEGEASVNEKGTTVYFTKCPQDKKKVMGCYIYTASKRGKSWSEPQRVEMNQDTAYNYVHPFITPDELTLFFASNKPGGQGGYDIYKATREKKSGKFTKVENCGENVNTPGQEVFPTLRGDSLLYFSSDGHPGMGGLDIFVSVIKNGVCQPAENLLYPINSNGDDMSIIFDDTPAVDPKSKFDYTEKGYFSSNRLGGRGGDDIYYFILRPLVYSIAGFVKDAVTLQYLDGVDVDLVGSDGASYKTQTDVKGHYEFDKNKIKGNTTYTLVVKKRGYWEENNTASQTTIGLSENTDLKQDFNLTPIPPEPIILPEILYPFDEAYLEKQYKDSMLFLYNVMIKNPTIVVELRSHTDYKGSDTYNEALSQRRAQSCVDFLVSEKHIPADRIIPKGYGEYRPRKIYTDLVCKYNGKTYTFPKGTELTESYINSLSDKNMQEAANALNRRTEFIVLSTDYVPKSDSIGKAVSKPQIVVVNERFIPVMINDKTVSGQCYANNKSFDFQIAKGNVVYMDYKTATNMLKDMIITAKDFDGTEKAIKQEDGSIIENSVLYISEFRIGDEVVENVPVIVKKGLGATFVIGGDYIQSEWGYYRIDNDRKMLIFE
ncbi:MAG: OmpA family protein [Bacteroidales bacterium]|nr:OmpA family protein [Bacteroidales bacterium]